MDEQDRETNNYKVNPFTVPDGYFEELPSRIQDKLSVSTHENASISIISVLKHRVGIATGILLFMAAGYSGYRYNKYVDEKAVLPEDYYEFVSANSSEFSEQEIIRVLNGDKKVASKKALKKESDKLIQYIVDQQVDLDAIEDEYNNGSNEID